MACGLMVLYISFLVFGIHIVEAKAAKHNRVARLESAIRYGEELMAKQNNLISEILAEFTKKNDQVSQEIAHLIAKATDENNKKI